MSEMFPTERAKVMYIRDENRLRMEVQVDYEEFITVLLGWWATMPEEARQDFINELTWYQDRMEEMPGLAISIRDALVGTRTQPEELVRIVDVRKLMREEYEEGDDA